MRELEKLAARCEAASGPDRELDAEIAVAVYGGEIVWKQANYTMEAYPARRHASKAHVGGFGNAPVEAVTASLDAALSLVPADHEWSVNWAGNSVAEVRGLPDGEPHKGYAATPALALTAACLRALSASRGGEVG